MSKRWEYKIVEINLDEPQDAEEELNDLGGRRWELVTVVLADPYFQRVFKRPSED